MQIELSEREIQLLLIGIKAGTELPDYEEDEYCQLLTSEDVCL